MGTPPAANHITSLGENDVLCGRGGCVSDSEGNKRFRLIIRRYRDQYTSSKRTEKQQLGVDIVNEIHSRGGRFLKGVDHLNGKDHAWVEVDESVAVAKVKQALREYRHGKWWNQGRATEPAGVAAVKKVAKEAKPSSRIGSSVTPHKSTVSGPYIMAESVGSDTLMEVADVKPPPKASGAVNIPPTAPPVSIPPPIVSPHLAPLPSPPVPSLIDPRLLLFQNNPVALQQQVLMPQAIDMISAMPSPLSVCSSPWDCSTGAGQLPLTSDSSRKSTIVSSHQRESEDLSSNTFLLQDFSSLQTNSKPAASPVTLLPHQDKEEASRMAKVKEDRADDSEMDVCASEDVAAFLLSSLSITDRPRITEEEEALERASLSTHEKASILSDALGIYPVHRNKKARTKWDRKATAFLVRRMKVEIERIPIHERRALVDAQMKCGVHEFSDVRLEQFLQCEGMDTKLAARRFVDYWTERRNVFGPEKYLQRMTLSEALRDDIAALEAGVFRLLPKPDAYGRPILFLEVARHTLNGYTSESLLRAVWYLYEVAARENRRSGIIEICWFKGACLFDYDLKVYDKLAYLMSSCFPIKVLANHLCCLPTCIGRIVRPIVHSFMSREVRTRTLTHNVPERDLLNALSNFGLTKDLLPTLMGGTLVLDQEEWIAHRRAAEMEEL